MRGCLVYGLIGGTEEKIGKHDVGNGTVTSQGRPDGGTDVAFELEWLAAPRSERLIVPLTRSFTRRSNGKALRRLKKRLEAG